MPDPYIISETACSHDGSPDRLKRLIDASYQSGCDAVQIQVWNHKNIATPDHPDIDTLRRVEISERDWIACIEYARGHYPTLELIACVYDTDALELCNQHGVHAFKIHTADLGNLRLVDTASETGKRIDLSVGASTVTEIQTALDCIGGRCDVWLMYGYQLFPTPTAGLNLHYMNTLHELFGFPLGYQDHSPPNSLEAFTIPVAALGAGVQIIEKHLTDDRSRGGVDSAAALEPTEMVNFVKTCREAALALGDGRHRAFTDEELQYRKYSKKSLVAARDLAAGEVIQQADVTIMRAPCLGIPADQYESTVGRRPRHAVSRFSPLQFGDLEDEDGN